MGRADRQRAVVIVDLGFGDAGKGTITDAVVRRCGSRCVVRYNGGAQAAHRVVTPEGKAHTFHQFGSGAFVPGVETLLSSHVYFNPIALYWENVALKEVDVTDALDRFAVHANALVTTPYHIIVNRIRELARGAARHGSCGMGIGETVEDHLACPDAVPHACDMRSAEELHRCLNRHRAHKASQLQSGPYRAALQSAYANAPEETAALMARLHSEEELEATVEVFLALGRQIRIVDSGFFSRRLNAGDTIVFEGAQGVLLDQDHGFHPHTTWSNTTADNAYDVLHNAGIDRARVTTLGVLRAFHTRHGAGPLPTEDAGLTADLQEPGNPTNAWQGPFRAGWFDLQLARYALRRAGKVEGDVDALAITWLDQIPKLREWKVSVEYREDGDLRRLDADFGRSCTPDLESQEQLGRSLTRWQPVYVDAPRDPYHFVDQLSRWLCVPPGVLSFGPTVDEKTFTSYWEVVSSPGRSRGGPPRPL